MEHHHTCILADDHDAIRDGVRSRLEAEGLAVVVGEARSGEQAVELCTELRPSLLVLDLRIPGSDGFEVLETLREQRLTTRALVFSAHTEPLLVERALSSGALAYVCKDSERGVLLDAVRATLDNRRYVDPSLIADLIAPTEPLSEREYQVLQLIGDGLQNDAIAGRLEVSIETVKTHVSSLLRKLDASTRTEAVATAFRRSLLR